MALRTTLSNTEKIGSVLVEQTDLVADTADLDVTTVATSSAYDLRSLQVVNGATQDIYFKVYDLANVTLNSSVPVLKFCVKAGTTQFVGASEPFKFINAISVAASTSSGPTNSGTTFSGGKVSYTLIAAK